MLLLQKDSKIESFCGPYFPAFRLNTPYLSVFSPNAGKYEAELLRIRTLSTHPSKELENIRFLGKMFSIFFYNQYNELYSNVVFIARNCSRVRLKYDFGKINGL